MTAKPTPWTQAPPRGRAARPVRAASLEAGGKRSRARSASRCRRRWSSGPTRSRRRTSSCTPTDGALVVPDELRWMVDFERAVADGLGFKVDLSPEQATGGFDRLLVLGVRLSARRDSGAAELEALLDPSPRRSQRVQPGAAGHADEQHRGRAAADSAGATTPTPRFDERRLPALCSTPADRSASKQDGQWLAEALGIDPAAIARVSRARRRGPARGAGDADRAVAGDARLLPARR